MPIFSVKKKYRHCKNIGFNKISLPANIGEEKISTMQKYPFRQNIVGGKISAKKKYQHCKNNGFDKISLPAKYRHRKNIGFNKISVEIKVARYQIGGN
jgi:hypothetical protein